jgi:hypothetical protein
MTKLRNHGYEGRNYFGPNTVGIVEPELYNDFDFFIFMP